MRASWAPNLVFTPPVLDAHRVAPQTVGRAPSVDRMEAPSPLGSKAARDAAVAYARAFGAKDAVTLDALTPSRARFFDPTLPGDGLTKAQSDGYWKAAFAPDNSLSLTTSPVQTRRLADGNTEASFSWVADYELGGRPVHNEVSTKLVLTPQGELLSRTDDFDTGRWLAQAAPLGIGKVVEGIDDLLGTKLSRTFAKLAVRVVLSDALAR